MENHHFSLTNYEQSPFFMGKSMANHNCSWEILWFPIGITSFCGFLVKFSPCLPVGADAASVCGSHRALSAGRAARSGRIWGWDISISLYVEYIYIYIYSHPGLDKLWNFQRSLLKSDDFWKSIYFRMTIHIYRIIELLVGGLEHVLFFHILG